MKYVFEPTDTSRRAETRSLTASIDALCNRNGTLYPVTLQVTLSTGVTPATEIVTPLTGTLQRVGILVVRGSVKNRAMELGSWRRGRDGRG